MIKIRLQVLALITCGVLLLSPAPFIWGEDIAPVISTVEQIQDDFSNLRCSNKDRPAAVRELLEKMGAPAEAVSVEKLGSVENIVIRQTGMTAETIIIGAHYDLAALGCGAVDNWSGIVAMAHLYRSIRTLPLQKSVLFVAFGKEELGLIGSKAMVQAIPKAEVSRYCAMINIDSFGLALPFALKNASSPRLVALAEETAAAMKIPFNTVPIYNADADSSPFVAKKIPAVTLSGLTSNWQSILHTTNDQKTKVNPTSVYLGYRLALTMWYKLDQATCEAYR